ncbi:hypothetical protein [Agrococcus casei]|uniref:hypothetical protein n=1 Tax=Agrococcus casei TaxID=343512 RepID=UPI003F904569
MMRYHCATSAGLITEHLEYISPSGTGAQIDLSVIHAIGGMSAPDAFARVISFGIVWHY